MKKNYITLVLTPYQANVVALAINEMTDLRNDHRILLASARVMLKLNVAQRKKLAGVPNPFRLR